MVNIQVMIADHFGKNLLMITTLIPDAESWVGDQTEGTDSGCTSDKSTAQDTDPHGLFLRIFMRRGHQDQNQSLKSYVSKGVKSCKILLS